MKTPGENLLSVVKDKKILFLDVNTKLSVDLNNVEVFLIKNNTSLIVLCNIRELSFNTIVEFINAADLIIFQPQWDDIALKLKEYLCSLKSKKSLIEVYSYQPTWFYKPRIVHDLYILKTSSNNFMAGYETDPIPYWRFHKLRWKKPFWKYKNKFDN